MCTGLGVCASTVGLDTDGLVHLGCGKVWGKCGELGLENQLGSEPKNFISHKGVLYAMGSEWDAS